MSARYSRSLSAEPMAAMVHDLTAEVLRISQLLPTEHLCRFGEVFKAAFKQLHFRVVDVPPVAAGGADQLTSRLEPCEGHFRLLAALRAYEGQGEFVFDVHGDEGTEPPAREEAGGAR